MNRYIDADKLQKDGWKLRREKHGLVTRTYETMELDCVPTADVIEVVRCKDCAHYNTYKDNYMCGLNVLAYVNEDDFCSRAERADT